MSADPGPKKFLTKTGPVTGLKESPARSEAENECIYTRSRFSDVQNEELRPVPGGTGPTSPTEIQKLVHELQIHQVELDMQNEELRRAEGETEAALAKYADLYDSAPIGYFTFNPQGLILEANLTGARLLGVERGCLLRTPFLPHVVPAFRAEFRAHLHQVFTTQPRHLAAPRLATSEGAARYVTLESIAVPAGRSLAQCRSAVSDCTARQLAEEDLRCSEEKFHLLFDQAPLGYQSLDEAGRILEVNQTWLDLMGYSREEVLGRWFGAFLKPGAQDLFQEGFTRFKADGEISGVEWEMVRQDGATIVASFNGRVIRDEQGRFLRTHCLFEDITARRQAERELKKSLALLHSTLESTADGILVVDRQGKIVRYNSKFMGLWRIPASVMASGDDRQVLAFVLDQLQPRRLSSLRCRSCTPTRRERAMTCWISRMDVFLSVILNLTGWRERLWAGCGVSGTSPPASRPRRKSTPPAPFWKILLAPRSTPSPSWTNTAVSPDGIKPRQRPTAIALRASPA